MKLLPLLAIIAIPAVAILVIIVDTCGNHRPSLDNKMVQQFINESPSQILKRYVGSTPQPTVDFDGTREQNEITYRNGSNAPFSGFVTEDGENIAFMTFIFDGKKKYTEGFYKNQNRRALLWKWFDDSHYSSTRADYIEEWFTNGERKQLSININGKWNETFWNKYGKPVDRLVQSDDGNE